ncbi:hypothetical protein KRX56_00790 [Dermabacteraceae bacterium TAE3-ERU27]|nr:hypothetical protein [Dermabacteraceae bacterium TAE3-ERU27]
MSGAVGTALVLREVTTSSVVGEQVLTMPHATLVHEFRVDREQLTQNLLAAMGAIYRGGPNVPLYLDPMGVGLKLQIRKPGSDEDVSRGKNLHVTAYLDPKQITAAQVTEKTKEKEAKKPGKKNKKQLSASVAKTAETLRLVDGKSVGDSENATPETTAQQAHPGTSNAPVAAPQVDASPVPATAENPAFDSAEAARLDAALQAMLETIGHDADSLLALTSETATGSVGQPEKAGKKGKAKGKKKKGKKAKSATQPRLSGAMKIEYLVPSKKLFKALHKMVTIVYPPQPEP